jgi:hypothetical protein
MDLGPAMRGADVILSEDQSSPKQVSVCWIEGSSTQCNFQTIGFDVILPDLKKA